MALKVSTIPPSKNTLVSTNKTAYPKDVKTNTSLSAPVISKHTPAKPVQAPKPVPPTPATTQVEASIKSTHAAQTYAELIKLTKLNRIKTRFDLFL